MPCPTCRPGDALPQIENDPRFEVVIGSTEGETILSLNNTREPFDDLRVRQAIAHAINRDDVIAAASSGLGVPIGSHFAPHHPAYVDLTDTYPHDPDRARELLAEAGHPDGFSATLRLPPPPYARDGGQVIASQLRQVGIELEIIPVEWAEWLSQVFTDKDFDMTIISHVEPMDIGIYARPDYYFQYQNEEFNALYEELTVTADEAAATRSSRSCSASWPRTPRSASSSRCPRSASGMPASRACGKTGRWPSPTSARSAGQNRQYRLNNECLLRLAAGGGPQTAFLPSAR
jgi:ABC-type transport system substrate-binding protein